MATVEPLSDLTEVVNPDRRVSLYWRGWFAALRAAVNALDAGTRSGTGSPEGVLAAPIGTIYRRTNGGAGSTLWVKEAGAGATGWSAK